MHNDKTVPLSRSLEDGTLGQSLKVLDAGQPDLKTLARRILRREANRPTVAPSRRFQGGEETRIVRWLDEHPEPSPFGQCAWCGKHQFEGAIILPFGTVPGTHTWLHAECWHPWHGARRTAAAAALAKHDRE